MRNIRSPLSAEQVRDNLKDGRLEVVITVALVALLQSANNLNAAFSRWILQQGSLSDVKYKIVGHRPPFDEDIATGGDVLLEVSGIPNLDEPPDLPIPLVNPLSYEEIVPHLKDDRLKAVVAIPLDELFDDIDAFNDHLDSLIIKKGIKGILADIKYKVVGGITPTDIGAGEVLVEVDAEVVND